MEYFVIPTLALIASILTFFSGFGLGTILLPVFGLFFPIEIAITLTAILHFLNNIFKLGLVFKNLNQKVVLTFGLPALLFSFIGAKILLELNSIRFSISYKIVGHEFHTNSIKIIIATILLFFSFFEFIPKLIEFKINKKYLIIGGIFSGFFGGISGHQGALRTLFLNKIGLSKESFIASGVAIAFLIDLSRITIYFTDIEKLNESLDYILIGISTFAGFIGVYLGNTLLKKVTILELQKLIAFLIVVFSLFFGMGII